tara:strand:+ start:3769 stop:4032 length:264 start_codon:yes stop_codon:yes gene_type:complete
MPQTNDYYNSVLFGMSFRIDDQGLLLACPTFKDGQPDIDNEGAVYDWENWDELNHHHHVALMGVIQYCILARDTRRVDYYARVFNGR